MTLSTLARGYGLIEGPLWLPDEGLLFSDVAHGGVFRLAADGAVETVVEHRRGIGGLAWHAAGGAHSFETWVGGQLVGGLYGVAIGRMFYGESMFGWASDASKIALAALVAFCRARGIALIDCQQNTAHLASLGAREVARADFERHLAKACAQPPVADWTYDRSLWAQLPPLRDPANPRSA